MTRVYTVNFRKDKYIVVDRLQIDKTGKKIASGDTKRIHARDVEEDTLAYMRAREKMLQVALYRIDIYYVISTFQHD